jgi:hypothetical protein
MPPATRRATSATASSTSAGPISRAGAPATTTVTSPSRSPAAQAASSAREPRRISSWVLVSSRHTTAARSPPNTAASSPRVAPVRRGDSKNTMVRRSAASSANRRARSPGRRGGNPSKQNRSLGSPDTASAAVTADGPGSTVTPMPSATAAAVSRYPGSLTPGMPASVTSSTSRPARRSASSPGARWSSTPS